jgi:circadian clock protein KaiC
MKKKIQLLPSGISLVDSAWGGFYRGGTYMLIGAHKTGRTLLGLQFALESARQKEVCLYFTNMRPKDLMIQAASIDFDLEQYMNQNLIIVVRVALPTDLYDVPDPDHFLAEYLNDINTVVDQYQPAKIVFDEITPFIGFNNLNLLKDTFLKTTEAIEDAGITSMFILGEPATPEAESIVNALSSLSTGIIYLKKEENTDHGNAGGKMVITPNIGHTQGKFSSNYMIEPYKGVTTEKQIFTAPEINKSNPSPEIIKTTSLTKERKYKSLADIDAPEEKYSYSNFYNINDFNLILNNQIALYKSTGQIFTIISFKLDMDAERKGLLTVNQLQNAIRLAIDRKDKICVQSNKVMVLVAREENQKSIINVISKIKSNLPSNDPNFIRSVIPYISVYAMKVDENVQNANELIEQLGSDEPLGKNKFGL